MVTALILNQGILMVSLTFTGHLGKEILDSAALAVTVINVCGNAVMYGLTLACDTLFPQTYGSVNKTKVGVILQRSVLILLMCCLPCFAVFMNTDHLLKLIGQSPIIANVVLPSLIIGLLANIVNVVAHATLIIGLNLGILGASVAVALALWSVVIFHVIYIIGWKVYRVTWTGFSWECLEDWGQFFGLAVPGMAMRCLEWWSFEVLILIAGLLGVTQLAGHTVTMSISYISFMVPYGVSIAASVRVGNNLGANQPVMAALSARTSLIIGGFFAVTVSVIILALKGVLPLAFTNDSDVVMLASNLLLILSLEHLTDAMQCVAGGILGGCGHQVYGAIMNLIGYYAIALPIAIFLMLKTYLMASGAWWGMLISTSFQTISFLLKIRLMDWNKEAQKAQDRAGVKHSESEPFNEFEGNVEIFSQDSEKSSILKKMEIQDSDGERERLIGKTKLTRKQIIFQRIKLIPVRKIRGSMLEENYIEGGEGILYIAGGEKNDTLHGGVLGNTLDGLGGSDIIYGHDGNDILIGGPGGDWLYGGNGDDTIFGGDGGDSIDGGSGINTIVFKGDGFNQIGVFVDLLSGNGSDADADGDTYTDIQNIYGSEYNDLLHGNHGDNVIKGFQGNDYIHPYGSNDILSGGHGADVYNCNDATGRKEIWLDDDLNFPDFIVLDQIQMNHTCFFFY
ncbi:hypothetical protein ACJMK2_018878 [Sinanodonta woodiana]|uniref:Multidrug and toxin extrusion protein n=1 Tax=Sinanodonta woodiana TaxID=1069815 RepID=A0ABD3UGD6_SINWO